jgi:hypothetical protein
MSRDFCTSTCDPSVQKIPPRLIERMVTALCYAA